MTSTSLFATLLVLVLTTALLISGCGGSSWPTVPALGEVVADVQMAGMMLPLEILATHQEYLVSAPPTGFPLAYAPYRYPCRTPLAMQ